MGTPLYTSWKRLSVELTEGEIQSLLEAAQTLVEVVEKEQSDTGEALSPEDRFLLKVLDRAAGKLNQALPS